MPSRHSSGAFTRIVVNARTRVILDQFLKQFGDVRCQLIDIFRLLLLDYFQIAKSNRQCMNRTQVGRGDCRRIRSNRCPSTAKENERLICLSDGEIRIFLSNL